MTKSTEADRAHVQRLHAQISALFRKKNPKGKFDCWEGFNLYSRHRWSREECRRFVRKCEEWKIVEEPVVHRSPLSFVLDDSVVTANEVLEETVQKYSGKYLLFTLVGDTHLRVTWIELGMRSNESDPPSFEALRPDPEGLIFRGRYYALDDTLFLFGHKERSHLPRSVYLSRTEARNGKDLLGVVSGASDDKRLFASACYAHALQSDVTFEDVRGGLGERSVGDVRKKHAHVCDMLLKHKGVQMDFPRESDA